MSTIIESHTPDVKKIRLFSLSVALILITYVVAGVELDSLTKVSLLGIPFVIEKTDYIAIGLVLASIYSIMRFIYFGLLVQPSPIRARSRLIRGSRVDTRTTPNTLEQLHTQVSEEIHRYFPSIGKERVMFEVSENNNELGLKVTVPVLVRIAARFEDIDYLSPIWVNIIALVLWMYHIYGV